MNSFKIQGLILLLITIMFLTNCRLKEISNGILHTTFERFEPEMYEQLNDKNLIEKVNIEEKYDEFLVNVEEVYYDQNIIIVGIKINYFENSKEKYLPIIKYDGKEIKTSGGRDEISSTEILYLVEANIEEILPEECEITLVLLSNKNTKEIIIPINRKLSDKYVKEYRLDEKKSDNTVKLDKIVYSQYCTKIIYVSNYELICDRVKIKAGNEIVDNNYMEIKEGKSTILFPKLDVRYTDFKLLFYKGKTLVKELEVKAYETGENEVN